MLSRICRFGAPVAAFLLSGLLAASASAVPIVGRLSILGTVRLTPDEIDFQAPLPLVGNFLNSEPSDGYFAGITSSGTALDLDVSAVGVPVSVPGFLSSFQAPYSTLLFELTLLQPGAFGSGDCASAPASGQVCTPAGSPQSPFSFVNFSTGSDVSSIVSFIVRGNVTANSGADEGVFTGVYTAQFVGLSYQEVLATLAGDGSVTASYSASFEVVPEPGAAALLGAGLVALALRRRSASAAGR